MYESKAFWGLEDNPNACAMNNSFNSVTNLTPMLIVVVVAIGAILISTTSRGFGE